jgi:hypothetical protein
MTKIFRNNKPSHSGDSKTVTVMGSTTVIVTAGTFEP